MSEPEYRASWLETSYDERIRTLMNLVLAQYLMPDDVPGAPLADVAMLLGHGRFVDQCEEEIRANLRAPGNGPFWMMQLVMVMYGGGDRLTVSTRDQIARSWETIRQQRGDTENHWVLFHTALYLAAQAYPEGYGSKTA